MVSSDRFTIPGLWLFLSFYVPYLLCFSKFANKRFWKRHLYSEDKTVKINKQTSLDQISKINENFKILMDKIIALVRLLDIRKYLLFENKKDLSLIIFLSIILKPFFNKLAFPFYAKTVRGNLILSTDQTISRHISEIFHHSESYIILFIIITFIFWYLGRIEIKNPFESKSNVKGNPILSKTDSEIKSEKPKNVKLKYHRIILKTTEDKVIECDKVINEDYDYEFYSSNEILEDALFFEPNGAFAIVIQVSCYDENHNIVGYLDFYESNKNIPKKNQKNLFKYEESKGYIVDPRTGEKILITTSYKSLWTIYYDKDENICTNKTLQNELEMIVDEEKGSTNNNKGYEIIRLEELDYNKRIIFD